MTDVTFADLSLNPAILRALEACGYNEPTPIQAQAIPVALSGRDLIASANTGTGKTAAFVLPALNRLTAPRPVPGYGPRVLVLSPTRELASQILEAVKKYSKFSRIATGVILGGMPYREQMRLLERRVDLLVATPGRLIDFIDRGRLDLSHVEMLVLDEADRMLDMGFIEAVETIAAKCPAERQTLLYTATFDQRMGKLASRLLTEPERVDIAGRQVSHESIDQQLMRVDGLDHKERLLSHLLLQDDMEKAIVFAATKRDADRLADDLAARGMPAAALHGDMRQRDRNRTLDGLRRGRIRFLVATDVAARGIDVADISHVINFDLPKVAEDYVHRIGRTGRAGATGTAYTFYTRHEVRQLRAIEDYIGKRLPNHVVPGMEPMELPKRVPDGNRPPRRANGPGSAGHGYRPAHNQGQGRPKRFGDGGAAPMRRDRGAAGA
ncbi:MAG TPA: DEAD/DEAH box helicase [Azospirillaceae bacterium]|nr:DEAD/DEAH box helicase [Azospirillaceae bacterium]